MRSLMKGSVRNSRRGLVHSWWVVLGMVFLLTACTVEESDGPVEERSSRGTSTSESDEAVEPSPSEHGDWQVPGLVDRSGARSRCRRQVRPRARPWTSRTSGQIRIRTHKTTQQPSGRPWTRQNRVTRSCCRPAL